jgi:hypothetical protein
MQLVALISTVIACSSLGACSSQRKAPSEQPAAQPQFRLTATIQDLMDSEIDPAADFLWDSVMSISNESGFHEKQPHTDEEWREVRRHAVTLVEATNLLVMNGRKVSAGYVPSAEPGELDSTAIQQAIDKNRPAFIGFAAALHDVGSQALHAIDAKDAPALFEIGSTIDAVCESCHQTFWYPKRSTP